MPEEITGRLEQWSGIGSAGSVLYGQIYNDSKGRFDDGTFVRTSFLSENYELGEGLVVKTKNSAYLLGRQAD